MDKPTVHDIAREAGVSLATVDRVLNDRAGVREKTVARVRDAVSRLGYVRDISAANLARQRRYRFVFMLPDTTSQFLRVLHDAVVESSAALRLDRCEIDVMHVSVGDPVALMAGFDRIEEAGVDGVAVMASETPVVRDRIARLKARGIAVAALITDQPNSERDHFVGIDNIAAGRTSGVLMGRFSGGRSGKVGIVVNSMLARDMVERRIGFDQIIRKEFPNLTVLPTVEGRDDHALTERVVGQFLDSNPGVIGAYCAGAGMRGLTKALTDRGLDRTVTVVAHDLTPHSRAALESGVIDVVINQNAGHLARSAARVLKAQCDGVEVIASQETIRIEIVLRENLP